MLHSLTLYVRNLENSKSFYECFGFVFTPMEPKGMGFAYHGYHALLPNPHEISLSLMRGEPGAAQLGFFVQSGGDVRDALRQKGFTPTPNHSPANPRGTFVYLDPDGRFVSFDEIG